MADTGLDIAIEVASDTSSAVGSEFVDTEMDMFGVAFGLVIAVWGMLSAVGSEMREFEAGEQVVEVPREKAQRGL